MSVAVERLRPHFTVEIDKQALYLASLFLAVTIGAIVMLDLLQTSGTSVSTPGNVDGAEAGAAWAIAEVAFAITVLLGIFAYRYLPTTLQSIVKASLKIVAVYAAGVIFYGAGLFTEGLAAIISAYATSKLVNHAGLWWLINNALCVGLAVAGAAVLALGLNEVALFVFLLGMTVYDRAFADKREYMFDLASLAIRLRLPVLFVKPTTFRFDWDDLTDELTGGESDEPDDNTWGIGTADLMLPAAFVAALATSDAVVWPELAGILATVGIVFAAFRIRHKALTKGSGAGLPPLTAGLAIAYLPLLAATAVVT